MEDGASAMKQLASLFKTRVSKHALYVHCFAHCNEKAFKDASSLSSVLSDAQDFCENVYVLAGMSPKSSALPECTKRNVSSRRHRQVSCDSQVKKSVKEAVDSKKCSSRCCIAEISRFAGDINGFVY